MHSRARRLRLVLSACVVLLAQGVAVAAADGRPTNFWNAAGARPNGLDLNDDFIVGQPGVDDTLCDARGGTNSSAGYLEDFDDDGMVEQQWFVVGANPPRGWSRGTNSPTCGSLANPCATVSQAWTNARNDGGAANGEDVVCIAGRMNHDIRTPLSGRSGRKVKRPAARTNEQWSFEYPRDPTMVVGVDSDDDGRYPPFDQDDIAEFRAPTSGENRAFAYVTAAGVDNVEVAHVTLLDWGSSVREGGGILRQGSSGLVDGLYFHDFRAVGVNRGQCHGSNTIMFSNFGSRMRHLAVEYADLIDVNGYVSRGGFSEPFTRFRGLHVDMIGLGGPGNTNVAGQSCNNSNGTIANIMRVWGLDARDNHVEWIDNDIEFVRWEKSRAASSDAGILLCGMRRFHFVGNRIVNFAGGMPMLNTKDNVCRNSSPHRSGDLAFERNTIAVTKPSLLESGRFINVVGFLSAQTGRDQRLNGAQGYYRVENNEVDYSSLGGNNDRLGAFVLLQNATDADYRGLSVRIANNDIVGRFSRNVGGLLWAPDAGNVGTPDDLVLEGNTVHDPFGGGLLEDVDVRGAQHIARVSGSGNSFAHCRWFWAGRRHDSPGSFDADSGLRASNCSNARPTLGNFTGGGGGGGGGGGATRLSFASATFAVDESAGSAQITVERRGSAAGAASVTFTAEPGTASTQDFVPLELQLDFAAGETTQVVSVEIFDDFDLEADETVLLTLSQASGGSLSAPTDATLTIVDDDAGSMLSFGATSFVIDESEGFVRVDVLRGGGLGGSVSVPVSVRGLSATEGVDYGVLSTTLQWAQGEGGARTLLLDVVDDGLAERTEIVRLELGTPTQGALLGADTVATVVVLDNDGGAACTGSSETLCLQGGRFQIESEWLDPRSGDRGVGGADPDSQQSGFFWFFDPDNVELIVKVLDGRSINDAHWLFYGALSDVEYYVTAIDRTTGVARFYRNEPGSLQGRGDVGAFPTDPGGEGGGSGEGSAAVTGLVTPTESRASAKVACTSGAESLCLQQGRFLVEVDWRVGEGDGASTGRGQAVDRTDASGSFWFFDPTNVELVVKVLDGRGVNGRHWVFWGAVTDVAYTLRVTDTSTGAVREYFNPSGQLRSGADIEAFADAN